MSDENNLTFRRVCEDIVSKETLDILEKYQCIDKIQKLLDEHGTIPYDLFDIASFFKDVVVVKIIKDDIEITINDITSNQMVFIDFSFKSFKLAIISIFILIPFSSAILNLFCKIPYIAGLSNPWQFKKSTTFT